MNIASGELIDLTGVDLTVQGVVRSGISILDKVHILGYFEVNLLIPFSKLY
jgi:hypothetical protein